MSASNSLAVWEALKPMVEAEIGELTADKAVMKKMVVSTAYSSASKTIGVREAFGDEIFLPAMGVADTSNMTVGTSVWVLCPYGSLSNAMVMMNGDGQGMGADLPELAPVATSGDYDDLLNKPSLNGVTLEAGLTAGDIGLPRRENLLDNGWFTVNQRGKSSYTGAVYGVDRWRATNATTTVTVTSGGITVAATGSSASELENRFETAVMSKLLGKKVTLSVMLSDGTIVSGSTTVPSVVPSAWEDVFQVSFTNGYVALRMGGTDANTTGNVKLTVNAGASISVRAVKLELGETSTLQYDSVPNYSTELLKCQRYLYRIPIFGSTNLVMSGYAFSATNVRALLPTPVPMRALPSIVYQTGALSNFYVMSNGASRTATSVSLNWGSDSHCGICFMFTTSGLSTAYPVWIAANSGVSALMSAEL